MGPCRRDVTSRCDDSPRNIRLAQKERSRSQPQLGSWVPVEMQGDRKAANVTLAPLKRLEFAWSETRKDPPAVETTTSSRGTDSPFEPRQKPSRSIMRLALWHSRAPGPLLRNLIVRSFDTSAPGFHGHSAKGWSQPICPS